MAYALLRAADAAAAAGDRDAVDEAIALHERTLADRERVLGADHPAGFVGLGGQGAPMAQALADSSYELHVLARPAGARS